jgi:hypothetical protein
MLKFFCRTQAIARTPRVVFGTVPVLGLALGLTLLVASSPAQAQSSSTPKTPIEKLGDHIDVAVSGDGEITKNTSGPITVPTATNYGTTLTQSPSNTVGVLVSLRYIAKPYFGLEFNFGYARYTENYSYAPYGVQTNAKEYTLGYVGHLKRQIYGVTPFAGAGAGTTAFKPTRLGGESLNEQARMTYFYEAGAEAAFSPHFGARVQFRQLFFLGPDFGQNYLTIVRHTDTIEPAFGLYLHF